MSDPSSASQNATFSQGVNANSPAQFNLSFAPPTSNNVNYAQNQNHDQSQNINGSGSMAMPPGVNPQMFFQNSNGNGFPQAGMNGQPQGLGQGMVPPHSASPVNGNQFDPAALQARIALAQQMAQQGMQQHNQQEQKVNGASGQGQGHERRTSASGSGPIPTGDWAQLANAAQAGAAGGIMPNAQATTREALMKQLQALQSSHAAATRNRLGSGSGLGQSPPAPSPGLTNVSQPSPIIQQSPLHIDSQIGQSPMSAVNPSLRSHSVDGGQPRPGSSGGLPNNIINNQSQFQQPNPPTPASSTAPGQPMRSVSGSQPPQAGSPAASTPTNINTPIRPPGNLPPGARQPIALGEQRRQFLQSLVNWHKTHNIPPPPEIFNSERSGAIKMGDTWVEVVELFLTVLRMGGIDRVTKLPPEAPFWQAFFKTRGIPNPLPTPVTLPAKSSDQGEITTTDPVRFLIRAYMVWLYGFEQHMNNSKMALAQRQQQQGKVGGAGGSQKSVSAPSPAQSQGPIDPALTPQANGPSPAPTTAPTPTMASAPTPTGSAPTPQSHVQNQNQFAPPMGMPNNGFPQQQMGYPPNQSMTPQMAHMANQQFVPPYPPQLPPGTSANFDNTARHVPPPIKTDSQVPMSGSHTGTPTPARGTGAKRGRKRKDAGGVASVSAGARSATTSRAATPAPAPVPAPPIVETPVARPPTPKRARYKVEYRPLHLPQKHLAGWDDRAVTSTFPKNNIGHPARSIHELGIVDMEAVLMGLRSRIPRELGYCLTVLSMLSMGSPEDNIPGLPLTAITEIYVELLELLSEAAFGEDGYEAWSTTAPTQSHLNDMSFGELEQIGRDFDFGLDERKDSTGGQTDIVLTCLNLLRNLSILPENCQLMSSHPEVFELLANLSDGRLCRLPASIRPTTATEDEHDRNSSISSKPKIHHQPFSIYELARVRRDVITILSNLGSSIELSKSSPKSIQQVVKVISSFLSSGWSMQSAKESLYGSHPNPHQPSSSPSPMSQHSVNRAVEAFCKLSWSDANREVLSKLPESQLVTIFESMLKLLPVQRRHFELLYSTEEYLGQTECLALSLYSLAFLAPLPTRTRLRNIPGGISVITRIIFDLSRKGIDFRSNPYAVLVRRLAETLGILNGTNGLESENSLSGMSFGAGVAVGTGSGSGSGAGTGNKVVQRGWLAEHEERVMESMGIRGIDVPAFVELDNLWWAGGE